MSREFKPHPYQHDIIDWIATHRRCAVWASMGSGKTVSALTALEGLALVEDVLVEMRRAEIADIPLIVGGIIPPEDAARLKALGVAAVYTPKDFDLTGIMADLVRVTERSSNQVAPA